MAVSRNDRQLEPVKEDCGEDGSGGHEPQVGNQAAPFDNETLFHNGIHLRRVGLPLRLVKYIKRIDFLQFNF